MLPRPSMLIRGETVLKEWPREEASDFTRMFVLIESTSNDGEGYTIPEIALILWSGEVDEKGKPTPQALVKANGLRNAIRRSPLNNMVVPYAIQQPVQDDNGKTWKPWVTINVRNKYEWRQVTMRVDRVITGYKNNMKRFGKLVDVGMQSRKIRFEKLLKESKEAAAMPLTNNKKKKNDQK